MSGKILYTELCPAISKGLEDKANVTFIENAVGRFVDKNSEKLSKIGPVNQIIFNDADKLPLYRATGLSPEIIKQALKKSPDVKSEGKIMQEPFNTLCVLILHHFVKTKNKKMVDTVGTYFILSMYPTTFFKYFKHEPNENIMNYTINNLSGKFKIRQKGNLLSTLTETVDVAIDKYEKDLLTCTDADIVDFVLSIKTRINALIKHIAIEFYANESEGNYINTEFESNEAGNFREAQASIHDVERIAGIVTNRLILYGPNIKLVTMSAKLNKVSVNELRNYVNKLLISDNKKDINAVIEAILYLFLIETQHPPEQIRSDVFLLDSLALYKKSNTNDKNIIIIKTALDKWLDDLEAYKKTERYATINNFRRALYTFFVLTIQTVTVDKY